MPKNLPVLLFLSVLTVSVVGCGKNMAMSPIAPAESAAASATSATISGSIVSGGAGLASGTTGGALPGLTVSVSGSSASAIVDVFGRFLLKDVPPGNVELRITGPGTNATVMIGTIAPGATIEVHVTVSGTTASVEDSTSSHDDDTEIEGRVEATPPITAAGQFIVAGKTITTSSSTNISINGRPGLFTDIVVGVRVHVKGTRSGTSVSARDVKIQNTHTELPIEVNGIISGLAGTSTAFTFDIGSRHISGSGATSFPDHRTFSDLKNGARVEVKGTLQNGVIVASRIEIEDDDEGPGRHGEEVEVSGTVSGLGGSCPALTFTIGATRITTSAATRFEVACASLANGARIEVKGTRATDGSIAATRVKRD